MSKKFLFIASILLAIIVGTVLFWKFCCCGNEKDAADKSLVPDEQVSEPVAPEPEPAPATDWQAVKQDLNDDPLTPVFEAYQTQRPLGQAELDMVDQIWDYINNNPDGSLLVVGHTDISGSRELNMRLSRERAEFMKGVLVQKGIPSERITASFKGPDEPAHDNKTFEGRAQNRRAVVLIK